MTNRQKEEGKWFGLGNTFGFGIIVVFVLWFLVRWILGMS